MAPPTAKQQRAWRAGAAASVTVHLSELDAATLDAIAIQLYELYPHDPPQGWLNQQVHPSRPGAIRALCAAWRAVHGVPSGALTAPGARGAFASFWRAESAWRQASSTSTEASRPRPPWRSGVLKRFARLRRSLPGLPPPNPRVRWFPKK